MWLCLFVGLASYVQAFPWNGVCVCLRCQSCRQQKVLCVAILYSICFTEQTHATLPLAAPDVHCLNPQTYLSPFCLCRSIVSLHFQHFLIATSSFLFIHHMAIALQSVYIGWLQPYRALTCFISHWTLVVFSYNEALAWFAEALQLNLCLVQPPPPQPPRSSKGLDCSVIAHLHRQCLLVSESSFFVQIVHHVC